MTFFGNAVQGKLHHTVADRKRSAEGGYGRELPKLHAHLIAGAGEVAGDSQAAPNARKPNADTLTRPASTIADRDDSEVIAIPSTGCDASLITPKPTRGVRKYLRNTPLLKQD